MEKENKKQNNKKKKNKLFSLSFLIFSIIIYIIILITNKNLFTKALNETIKNLIKILYLILIIYILMIIFDVILSNKNNQKSLNKILKSKKGIIISIISGIISAGSIYLWYPFLKNLKDAGVSLKNITIFLYNRAIKIPLIPIMFLVFDLKFILILFFMMIIFSVIEGYLVEFILKKIN